MKKHFSIIHLSDLHFGRIQPETLKHLDEFLTKRKDEISLAILTGDLTQRARTHEFKAAKDFIDSLQHPLFLVPGNHDVPLYNLFLRWFSPYKKFLKNIGPTANYYEDENVAVFGLWTVDNFAIQSGKIRRGDLISIENRFHRVSEDKIKIIACHHPLMSIKHLRIKNDLERLMRLKPHFFLWGHEHRSAITPVTENEIFPQILACGTTTSSRLRNEANSFNLIHFRAGEINMEIYQHSVDEGEFQLLKRKTVQLPEILNDNALGGRL